MNEGWLMVFGMSLGLTLIFELTFALIWGIRGKRDLLLCAAVNVLTNPIVVALHYWTLLYDRPRVGLVTALCETGAVLVEGLLYRRFGKNIFRPCLFALCANAFSYAVGELINGLM